MNAKPSVIHSDEEPKPRCETCFFLAENDEQILLKEIRHQSAQETFGGSEEPEDQQRAADQRGFERQQTLLTDGQALERYRYMLRSAPPGAIEQAHQAVFAKLTPEQRALALQQLTATMPEYERAAAAGAQDDPKTLARLATRAQLRQLGSIERTFGGDRRIGGIGSMSRGMFDGNLLSSLAAGCVGSMIAHQLFESFDNDAAFAGSNAE